MRCSRSGPIASDGKKVSAPTIIITASSITTNAGLVIGIWVAFAGDWFFLAREPATAIAEITVANLPKSIANEPVRLKNGVLAERPPKAYPLLPTIDALA